MYEKLCFVESMCGSIVFSVKLFWILKTLIILNIVRLDKLICIRIDKISIVLF